MNKTTEARQQPWAALKLAEEALSQWKELSDWDDCNTPWDEDDDKALAAIREALAEPEVMETIITDHKCGGCAKTAADGWALYCVECWEKAEPVKQGPVACVNGCDTSNGKCADCPDPAPVQPVKQEPVAWAHPSGGYLSDKYIKELATGMEIANYNIPLYAAPVDAKAIRAEALKESARFAYYVRKEALEEAAKWFESSGANMMTKAECAAAIRGLK